MVSCRFSEGHFTLIHSHKLSNQIYLLHELSLFIFSILHPFSAEDWLLEINDIHIGTQKNLCSLARIQRFSNSYYIAVNLKGNTWQINCGPIKTEFKTHLLSVLDFIACPWSGRASLGE